MPTCVDELDTGVEPPVEEGVETDLAPDGDPLAYGIEEGVFDSIVHPVRGRIDLTISTTDPMLPNAAVELDIQGVAREQIDGGEVVLTLPTKALMDHVGEGRPDLPVKARWDLPAMGVGDTWSGTYTVPGAAAGYYRVMVNAYTHGPDGGPYLFDDEVRQAWMLISETDGQLTRFFEDTIFPEGVHPMAGPADGGMYSRPDSNETPWHPDSVYLAVVYSVSERDGFKTAAGTVIWANWWNESGELVSRRVTVPEDSGDPQRFIPGTVAFGCGAVWGGAGFPTPILFREGGRSYPGERT